MPLISTEIHIPASPNIRFANMLFFLVHSIAANSDLPGPWRIVITLGCDGDLNPGSPEFNWARNFPVKFHQVDPDVWREYEQTAMKLKAGNFVYTATGLAQFDQAFEADVVLFLDADTIVTRSLRMLVERVHAEGCLAAKPAWQPPNVDLEDIIARRGLDFNGQRVTYSGYGWQFLEPRFAPPYFNFGVLFCARDVANLMREQLLDDLEFVNSNRFTWFGWQIALTLVILRNRTPFLELDERYNYGIAETDDFTPSLLAGDEGRKFEQLAQEQCNDIHVLHYCTTTPSFSRNTVMADSDLIRRFHARTDLLAGERILQSALGQFIGIWENWQACMAGSDDLDPQATR